MKNVDKEIINFLNSEKLDYKPYNHSLKEKLLISKKIKQLINNKVDYFEPNLDNSTKAKTEKLKKTGIIQFKDALLSSKKLKDIHEFLKNEYAYPAHISYYDKYHPVKDPHNFKGKIASFNANSIVRAPHLIELLSNKTILDIVTSHLGTTPTLFDLNIIFSFGDTEVYHETQHFHRDHDDFHHCLLMVYLDDVDEDCGGHIYACGSHEESNKSAEIKPTIKFNNVVDDVLDKNDKFEYELVLGKAGTGFLTDANGLHAGSVPKLGKRRMIFWARFGLSENYMWEVHNHRWWGFNNKIFKKRINKNHKNADHIFRLFTTDYDRVFYKNKKTIGDEAMKKTSKLGWNVIVYGKNYYAMRQCDGPINIEEKVNFNDDIITAQDKLKDLNILISNDELSILNKINMLGYPEPVLLEEGFFNYNIVGFGPNVFAIPQKLGSIDLENYDKLKSEYKDIVTGKSLFSIKENIHKNFINP